MATRTDPTRLEAGMGDSAIKLHRTFRATRERVWAAFTRPEFLVLWLGPVEWPATSVTQDLRVGGAWSAVLRQADGSRTLLQQGTYCRIEPPGLLEFTFRWGDGHEDGEPVDTLVTIVLTDLPGDRTLMDFSQTGLKSPASAGGHRHGWSSSFERLVAMLDSPTDGDNR